MADENTLASPKDQDNQTQKSKKSMRWPSDTWNKPKWSKTKYALAAVALFAVFLSIILTGGIAIAGWALAGGIVAAAITVAVVPTILNVISEIGRGFQILGKKIAEAIEKAMPALKAIAVAAVAIAAVVVAAVFGGAIVGFIIAVIALIFAGGYAAYQMYQMGEQKGKESVSDEALQKNNKSLEGKIEKLEKSLEGLKQQHKQQQNQQKGEKNESLRERNEVLKIELEKGNANQPQENGATHVEGVELTDISRLKVNDHTQALSDTEEESKDNVPKSLNASDSNVVDTAKGTHFSDSNSSTLQHNSREKASEFKVDDGSQSRRNNKGRTRIYSVNDANGADRERWQNASTSTTKADTDEQSPAAVNGAANS